MEIMCTVSPYQGFKSPSLRQTEAKLDLLRFFVGALRRGNKPPVILGEEKTLVYVNKTSRVIIVNGLATALLKYRGGFKRC